VARTELEHRLLRDGGGFSRATFAHRVGHSRAARTRKATSQVDARHAGSAMVGTFGIRRQPPRARDRQHLQLGVFGLAGADAELII